jgi:DNA adenine methylase
MAIMYSPLRYPGGKQILSRLIAHLIHLNGAAGGTYVEPYAGGAGVALALLFGEHVDKVIINDADPSIYACWQGILEHTDKFLKLIRDTPTTVEEWERQRQIYLRPKRYSAVRIGFATFFLNRCNRSGIIANGGPIGGKHQAGTWKMDARYNRVELARRVSRIAMFGGRIATSNLDAIEFFETKVSLISPAQKPFVYLDPPYYAKGRDLYLNYYTHEDHARLASYMREQSRYPWVMSYDCVPQIVKLYSGFRQVRFSIDYSARERRQGSEVMIFRPVTAFPSAWIRSIPNRFITSADNGPAMPYAV